MAVGARRGLNCDYRLFNRGGEVMFVEFAKNLFQITCCATCFYSFFHSCALQNVFSAFAVLVRVRLAYHTCATGAVSRLTVGHSRKIRSILLALTQVAVGGTSGGRN